MNVPRSKLFLAGDRLDQLAQAMAAGADALSIDLEDAVAEADKVASRDAVARLLRESRLPIQVWVRVNGADSGHLVHDLQALRGAHVDVINDVSVEARRAYVAMARLTADRALANGSLRATQAEALLEVLAEPGDEAAR